MTPEQQRIAIAEACGWTHCRYDWRGYDETSIKAWIGISPINNAQGLNNPEIASWPIPDYINDLNAMHEAEKVLNEVKGCVFSDKLLSIMNSSDGVSEFMKIHATAAHRAEAFLKTLDLWKP